MECKFFIGQKVVSTQSWEARDYLIAVPIKGGVYTIRDIIALDYDVGLVFVEIVNAPVYHIDGFGETAFAHQYFRPATDITIFNEILANAPKELEPV